MRQNIWAVGRNYLEHARELGSPPPSADGEPMIFLKAGSGSVENGRGFLLPRFSENVQYEIEVALRFGADFRFDAITLAVDLTARDIQNRVKTNGHPWTLAKSFRDSCLLGPFVALDSSIALKDLQNLDFQLKVNGEIRQKGNTRDMIFPIEKLRRYVLERFPVIEGDLLLTGTPSGVGPLHEGDALEAEIPGILKAAWRAALTSA